MKLVDASSPGMDWAHRRPYVCSIVDILLADRALIQPIANFLRKFYSSGQEGYEAGIEALRLLYARPNANGDIEIPAHVKELLQCLQSLYHQKSNDSVNYCRGAIIEQFVKKLISHRYQGSRDECENNKRFVDEYQRDITVQQVDVAALSNLRKKLEGYECKLNPGSFEAFNVINLSDLSNAAEERDYRSNVGFISFGMNKTLELKLSKFRLPSFIKVYGLESLEKLGHISDLED